MREFRFAAANSQPRLSPSIDPAKNMSFNRIAWTVAIVAIMLRETSSAQSQELSFERHIRPILRQYCFDCHGAAEKKESNLDLRLVRFMKLGGDSGSAVSVGKANDSLLIQRIVDGEMPPGETHLPATQLEVIKQWID